MTATKIIKKIITFQKENKRILKYNCNLVDELHANENAHTRFLLKLLNFQDKSGRYIFLESFIDKINDKQNYSEKDKINFINDSIRISGQKDYMDGRIKCSEKDILIIENKINWAKDQEKQIETYVRNETKTGHRVFLMYLTENGLKKPKENSFTYFAKELLDYKNPNDPGRYIEFNYLEHILPFLNEKFDEIKFTDENMLKTALFQYIDYLEGRFGIREIDKEYRKIMNEELNALFSKEFEKKNAQQRYDFLENLKESIVEEITLLENEILPLERRSGYIANLVKIELSRQYDYVHEYDGVYYFKKSDIKFGFSYEENYEACMCIAYMINNIQSEDEEESEKRIFRSFNNNWEWRERYFYLNLGAKETKDALKDAIETVLKSINF